MRIASWNVNSIRTRLPHLKDWLQTVAPDVVVLQELKAETLPDEIHELGYHITAVTQKAYNGVAILSKEPLETVSLKLDGDATDEQARFVHVSTKDFDIIGIYLPNGNPIDTPKFSYKLQWMDRLTRVAASLRAARRPFVILGDFNVIPEALDAKKPENWKNDALYQPESRAAYMRLIGLGLFDCYRLKHPDKADYTFWDYQMNAFAANNGIRIDHILASPTLADKLLDCTIDRAPRGWERPSDHTPIWADFAA